MSFEWIVFLLLTSTLLLKISGYINEILTGFIIFSGLLLIVVKHVFVKFLNFLLDVRGNEPPGFFFRDNRVVSFLTFDFFKFILILIAFVVVLILGLTRVLDGQTIATLLGGLLGSLLTLKGSYQDLNFKPDADSKKEDKGQST